MFLVAPPTYLPVPTFKGMANDFDLSSYTDVQLTQKLNAASAWANAIMKRNLLAQEQVIRYIGDGTDKLDLMKSPILYIKRAQIVIPGPTGYSLPMNELLIDYEDGSVFEYAPLYWAGAGYRSLFPRGAPFDITLGWGYGYTAAVAPPWTAKDVSYGIGGLAAGHYNIAVTAKTFWGETPALVTNYNTATGFIQLTVTSGIAVYTYRLYLSSATNNTTLLAGGGLPVGSTSLVVASATGIAAGGYFLLDSTLATQEVVQVAPSYVSGTTIPLVTGTVNAHGNGASFIVAPINVYEMPVSAFGGLPITFTANTLTPQNNLIGATLPTTDTSAPPVPWEIQEATRLLTLVGIFEQNNLANRGIYQERSGERLISWKSTEGMSGRGTPTLAQQAEAILAPFIYRGIA